MKEPWLKVSIFLKIIFVSKIKIITLLQNLKQITIRIFPL